MADPMSQGCSQGCQAAAYEAVELGRARTGWGARMKVLIGVWRLIHYTSAESFFAGPYSEPMYG